MRLILRIILLSIVALGSLQITAIAQNAELWGVTSMGGAYGAGTIFKTDVNGDNHQVQLSFSVENKGDTPYYLKLCEGNDGLLYGMTLSGGNSGLGVLFAFDPTTESYTTKVHFNAQKGAKPYGSLMLASNGKLYGMTSVGGEFDVGVLFEFDPTSNTYTKKVDFDASKGRYPRGALIEIANGKLYGMTTGSEILDGDVLFEYDLTLNSYSKKVDFDGASLGAYPQGSLIRANNGKLYGLTRKGGAADKGVIFEFDPETDQYTKILDFNGEDFGSSPNGSLMQASNGKLYGMAQQGGAFGQISFDKH